MNKNILVFISLFSSFIFVSTYTYRPMTKRTFDFGEDVCYYEDILDRTGFLYVKPCEEGKRCLQIQSSDYKIHTCVAYEKEYDNKNANCVTKDNYDSYSYGNGIDCTGLTCTKDKCGGTCSESQVIDILDNNKCVEEPNICEEYDSNGARTKWYSVRDNKKCVQFELQSSNNKVYNYKKVYSNSIASIPDGEFIKDDSPDNIMYCSSGYALYFYGDKGLKNPNTDSSTNHVMYLMCVTVLGRDTKGIIKYAIGNGDEKYYDPNKLPYKPSSSSSSRYYLNYNDEFLMTRLEMFKKYKESLNDPNESAKWEYFYNNPKNYLLYQNEPQIVEYLIKEVGGNYEYKVQHTASTESSSILKMKYLIALLSLILLF